jgi:hypothetical protein
VGKVREGAVPIGVPVGNSERLRLGILQEGGKKIYVIPALQGGSYDVLLTE